MPRFKRILVPVDAMRPGGYALDIAIDFARRYDGEVFLLLKNIAQSESSEQKYFWLLAEDEDASRAASADVGADPVETNDLNDAVDERLGKVLNKDLNKDLNKGLNKDAIPVHRAHLDAQPIAPAILDYAANNRIDLIVMETYGHRSLGRFVFGGTAGEVVRWSKCPVLTVRKQASSSSPFSLQRLLVPVDFSRYSTDTLRLARNLAVQYEASIHLLFVYEERPRPPFVKTGPSGKTGFKTEVDAEEIATTELKKLHDRIEESEAPVSYHVRRGHVSKEILEFAASQESDLIITTSHGLTDNPDFTLGSVTEKVIRRARCPVLTLKASHQPEPDSDNRLSTAV